MHDLYNTKISEAKDSPITSIGRGYLSALFDSLSHHGILGQKWHVRRFQNADGSLTPAGKERYGKNGSAPPHTVKLENYSGPCYFISEHKLTDFTLEPRVPHNYFTQNGYEDTNIKRVCFSDDVGKCLTALGQNVKGKTFYVYSPDDVKKYNVYKPNIKAVPDSDITNELWITESVKMKSVGKIVCTGDDGKDGMKFSYGNKQAELYGWNYEWKDDPKFRKRNIEFENTEKVVQQNSSNKYESFQKQPIDRTVIKERAGLKDKDTDKVISLANKKFDEAAKLEPQITKDVVSAVSKSGSKMYGLEYRLKQPSSLAGKIGADSKDDGVSFEQASNGIKDAIRYTSITDTNNFVNNYQSVKATLESAGYTETKCKNYYEKYKNGESMHKAVQCNYKSPDGYTFEIQFQTPSSQAAKELKIPIYEERRQVGISSERATELEAQMRDLAENVQDPPGIDKIKSH